MPLTVAELRRADDGAHEYVLNHSPDDVERPAIIEKLREHEPADTEFPAGDGASVVVRGLTADTRAEFEGVLNGALNAANSAKFEAMAVGGSGAEWGEERAAREAAAVEAVEASFAALPKQLP